MLLYIFYTKNECVNIFQLFNYVFFIDIFQFKINFPNDAEFTNVAKSGLKQDQCYMAFEMY